MDNANEHRPISRLDPVLVAIVVGAEIIGLWLLYLAAEGGPLIELYGRGPGSDVVKELGVAFVIFGLVTITFEGFSRSKLEENFQKDLAAAATGIKTDFNRLIQGLIDEKIVNFFNEFSVTHVFSRHNFVLDVDINDLKIQKETYSTATITFEYAVCHKKRETLKYILKVKNDQPIRDLKTQGNTEFFYKYAAATSDHANDNDSWVPLPLSRRTDADSGEDVWTAEADLPADQTLEIRKIWHYVGYPQDRMPLFMTELTMDAVIKVKHPAHRVWLTSLSPLNQPLTPKRQEVDNSEWESKGPFLPGHAFQLRWAPLESRQQLHDRLGEIFTSISPQSTSPAEA